MSLDRLKAGLSDRYRVDREVGVGGMATVYLAEDIKHRRQVALKVLRAEVTGESGPERFRREIEIAAALRHPHILPVYDSGEVDGLLYYVMPYEAGASLRDRLDTGEPFAISTAVTLLREISDALAEAHRNGVVHRDIKPENILLSGKHAVVTDFGIAKAVSEVTGVNSLTTAGMSIGTPTYMAPEQAAADPNIDHRVDIYAFGVLAYEILCGKPPFTGDSAQSVIAAHLGKEPRALAELRSDTPPKLASLVMSCLAKSPSDRPNSAGDILFELESLSGISGEVTPGVRSGSPLWKSRRFAAALAAIAAVAVVGYLWYNSTGRIGTLLAQDILSQDDVVLVGEFNNRTTDSTLAAAITDAIRVELQDSRVVNTLSLSDTWDGIRQMGLEPGTELAPEQVRELAERLNAKAYVVGEVSKVGTGYQITARIVATIDGEDVRSVRTTAANDSDLIEAIGDLGIEIRSKIGESLRSVAAAPRLARVITPSLQALRLYVSAIRVDDTGERFRAIAMLEEATSIDTAFAAAWNALSVLHINSGQFDESVEAARIAARFPERLTARGKLLVDARLARFEGDKVAEENIYRRMVELDSADASALGNLSDLMLSTRRFAEAEQFGVQAIRADSSSPVSYWNTVEAQVAQGKEATADSTISGMQAVFPGNNWVTNLNFLTAMAFFDTVSYLAMIEADVESDFLGATELTCWKAKAQGQYAEFDRCGMPRDPQSILAEFRLGRDTTKALNQMTALHSDTVPLRTPDLLTPFTIALIAEAGMLDSAKVLRERWVAELGAESREVEVNGGLVDGVIASAEGNWQSAADAYLKWNGADFLTSDHYFSRGLAEAALAIDRAGNPDSAIVLFETALNRRSISPGWAAYRETYLAFALRRLGELYEDRDRDKAVDYYSRLLDHYGNADAKMDWLVEPVQQRLSELVGEPGS